MNVPRGGVRSLALLVLLPLVLLASPALAQNPGKALVIGNKNYPLTCGGNLHGAEHDAESMQYLLEQAGWTVVRMNDLTRNGIVTAIEQNVPPTPQRYLVYFAGHGVNTGAGQGALVGTDCNSVSPFAFLLALGTAKERTIVILDSCGSGGFAHTAENAQHVPAFLTATRDEFTCAVKSGAGGAFTRQLRLCANVPGSRRTLQQVRDCIDSSGYVAAYNQFYYNGGLPDTILGSAPASGAFCAGTTLCPCGNAGSFGNGCANSLNAQGASLYSTGSPSVNADNVTLVASGLPQPTEILFFQGTLKVNGSLGIALGDGLRCVGGSTVRLSIKQTANGVALFPDTGDPQLATAGTVFPGETRLYQGFYRDSDPSFCTPTKANLTNALALTWTP